jgi:hypothetical protein
MRVGVSAGFADSVTHGLATIGGTAFCASSLPVEGDRDAVMRVRAPLGARAAMQ